MPALRRGRAVVGQLVIEVDVDGPREVTLEVRRAAVGPIEAPAHVEDAQLAPSLGEFLGRDQDRHRPRLDARQRGAKRAIVSATRAGFVVALDLDGGALVQADADRGLHRIRDHRRDAHA